MEQIENKMIDKLTGEILESDTAGSILVDDLPKVVRILRALEKKQEHTEQYIKNEVARLTDYCNNQTETILAERAKFEQIAERLLRGSGQKKLSYPGLGTVRIGTTRENVDTSGYDSMDTVGQKDIQEMYPELFRTTIRVAPDKKAIGTAIKGLNEELENGPPLSESSRTALVNTDLFKLSPKQETFVFKAEV